MNGDTINAVIQCAFKICYIYFLKCFLPSITLGTNINLFASTDYDGKLLGQINVMKRLFAEQKQDLDQTRASKNNKKITDKLSKSSDYTRTDEHDASVKDAAYSEIKKTISSQLREKYGDDICVDFSYDNDDKNKDKMLYSLKIKRLGISTPDPDDYSESDVYVNTKTKTFHVKTGKGFISFPLIKHSIVKCERS